MRHCFGFFSCALLVTSCCCLYHLSADDETSNVLKRSVKNVHSRFGSLLYIKFISLVFRFMTGATQNKLFCAIFVKSCIKSSKHCKSQHLNALQLLQSACLFDCPVHELQEAFDREHPLCAIKRRTGCRLT